MRIGRSIVFAAFLVFGWSTASAVPAEMTSVQWTLTHVNGNHVRESLAYLEIDASGNRFSGIAGCNRMFGNVNIDRKRIEFSQIGTTRMACPSRAISKTESDLLRGLRDAASFSLSVNKFTVRDRSGRTILGFIRLVKLPPVQDPLDQPKLNERKWVLENIKAVEVVIPKGEIFINFDAAKRGIGGNSGCNVFGGEYSVGGSKIEIKDMISTMRACIEDDRMSVERHLFDGLRAADRFEIRGEKLYLYGGMELLLSFRGVKK